MGLGHAFWVGACFVGWACFLGQKGENEQNLISYVQSTFMILINFTSFLKNDQISIYLRLVSKLDQNTWQAAFTITFSDLNIGKYKDHIHITSQQHVAFIFFFYFKSYYPFLSNVRCEHKVNGKHQLKGVTCLQQQIFQPSAYNGSIYASYMTNIRYTF